MNPETSPLTAAETIKVVYQSTPLDTIASISREIRDVPFQGWTIREHILQFVDESILDNDENKIVVIVNDERIPREDWDTTIPPAGSLLGIVSVPQVTALAGLLVAAGVGATAATVIATVIILGALVGLNILLGVLLAPDAPSGSSGGSNALLLSGAKNEERPFRSVPRVYGNWRYSPPIAGSAITEPSGRRFQTVRQLFTWGPGPLLIENLRIGDTDFSSFVAAESETKTLTAGDKVISLYPRLAQDLSPNVLLRDQHPRTEWFTRTTTEDTVQFEVDFLAPNGMKRWKNNKKKKTKYWKVWLEIEYKLSSDTEWTPWIRKRIKKETEKPFWESFSKDVAAGQYDIRARLEEWKTSSENIFVEFRGGKRFYTRARGGSGKETSQLLSDFQWVSLRSYEQGNPVEQENIVVTAIKLRSSEQLSGAVDTFNGEVTSLLPEINSDLTLTSGTSTRNPARICLDILTASGSGNLNPVPLNKIDMQSFRDWQQFCVTEDLTADIVFDFDTSVFEAFNTVARVGRATLGFVNGDEHTVIVDDGTEVPTQIFTPRNSNNFSVQRVFSKPVHGVRVRFPDRDKNFSAEEIIVYNDGFDASNATEFQSVDTILGLTEASKIQKHFRYEMLAARYRSEIFSLETGLDGLIPNRGDTVQVRSDIALIGTNQAIVSNITYSGSGSYIATMSIDEEFTFDPAKSYAIEARRNADTSFVSSTVSGTGTESLVTPTTVLASGVVEIGDLLAFGEAESVVENMRIIGVERTDDLSVKLSMVRSAAEIFTTLASGTAPAFSSSRTVAGGFATIPPAIPEIFGSTASITGFRTDGEPIVEVTTLLRPGAVTSGTAVAPTIAFHSQWRRNGFDNTEDFGDEDGDEPQDWITLPRTSVETGEISFQLEELEPYDLRVWALSKFDTLSSGTAVVTSGTIIGDANPPTNLRIENAIFQDTFGVYNVMKIRWDRPVGGTAIRYIVQWTLSDGDVRSIETVELFTDVRSAERGTYAISVQAVDLGQTLSVVVEDDFEYTAQAPANPFRVSGLEIVGQGNTFEFEGPDVHVVWRVQNTSNLDALESGNFGSGADAGSQDLLFRDYEISVINPVTSGTRRTTYVQDPAYTYPLSQNVEDSSDGIALREFTISVAARDISNQVGDASSITVSNPAPAALSNIQITRELSNTYVSHDFPQDPDFSGILVWAGGGPSVDLVPSGIVFEGAYSDRVVFNLDTEQDFYLRVAAYDSFSKEPSNLNVSDEIFSSSVGISLQNAYDGGAGDVITEAEKPFLVTGSGVFTDNLEVQNNLFVPTGSIFLNDVTLSSKTGRFIQYVGTGSAGNDVQLFTINRCDVIVIQRYTGADSTSFYISIPGGDTGDIFRRSSNGNGNNDWNLDAPASNVGQTLTLNGTSDGFNRSGTTYRLWCFGTRKSAH